MFDNADAAHKIGANTAPFPQTQSAARDKAGLDQEPAWKSDFRRTLEEINSVGFGAYTAEIQERKMEELREKILASMGLTEDGLENMSSEQRGQVEKMIALEIQTRLAAEKALDEGGPHSPDQDGAVAEQLRAAPNGMSAMLLVMQEIDAAAEPEDQTG
ncbi:MAG: hypothetical protein WD075_06055 [Rhodospirillales bacterium]